MRCLVSTYALLAAQRFNLHSSRVQCPSSTQRDRPLDHGNRPYKARDASVDHSSGPGEGTSCCERPARLVGSTVLRLTESKASPHLPEACNSQPRIPSLHVESTPSLSSMPTEILINVFEYCPNLPTAASLARSSKTLNNVWNRHAPSICEKILTRSTECYDRAWTFVDAFIVSMRSWPAASKRSRATNRPDFVGPFSNICTSSGRWCRTRASMQLLAQMRTAEINERCQNRSRPSDGASLDEERHDDETR